MKVSIPTLLLSTAFGILIFTIISFVIVWLGFPTEKPQDSFKDALSFSGGVFAGSTTFGAAIIAGFLFNDWREQHNKQVRNDFSLRLFDQYTKFDNAITDAKFLVTELEDALPEDSNSTFTFNINKSSLDRSFFKENLVLIDAYEKKIEIMQSEFNKFLDCLRHFGIVADKFELICTYQEEFLEELTKIHTIDTLETIHSYPSLIARNKKILNKYTNLSLTINTKLIVNVLTGLKVN